MNSAGKVSARHGHPRETLNLKRGGQMLTKLEHKKRQTKEKKKKKKDKQQLTEQTL